VGQTGGQKERQGKAIGEEGGKTVQKGRTKGVLVSLHLHSLRIHDEHVDDVRDGDRYPVGEKKRSSGRQEERDRRFVAYHE